LNITFGKVKLRSRTPKKSSNIAILPKGSHPFLLYVSSPFVVLFGRNYTEFLAATLEAHGHIEEERIADAFDRLDCDGSGYVSKEDLKEFLGNSATAKEIDDIIKEGDKDKDGQRECLF
jgi:hypothetical protein